MSFSRVEPGEKPMAVAHRGYVVHIAQSITIGIWRSFLRIRRLRLMRLFVLVHKVLKRVCADSPDEGLTQDVHMSKDGVVVICHDALLKRIYGVDAEVTSLPWKGGLDQLRTIREPHSPMLTFRQLLDMFASAKEGNGSIQGAAGTKWSDTWVLMDIKVPRGKYIELIFQIDNPIEIISAMKDDLVAVNPDMSFWARRMMFVCSECK